MKFELYQEVVLTRDMPNKGLKAGDVATIVDFHATSTSEAGYTLEVFNVLGDTITVITVSESTIEGLSANELFSVRPIALNS